MGETFQNLFALVRKRVIRFGKRQQTKRNVAMCDRMEE
jgi:hypothetical protein